MVISVAVDASGKDERKQESNLLSSHKYFTSFGLRNIVAVALFRWRYIGTLCDLISISLQFIQCRKEQFLLP